MEASQQRLIEALRAALEPLPEAFEREPVPLHRFRVRTYCAHADREPVERYFREVTRNRLVGEAPRRG